MAFMKTKVEIAGTPINPSEQQPMSFYLRDGSFGQGGMLCRMTWDEIRDETYQGRGA